MGLHEAIADVEAKIEARDKRADDKEAVKVAAEDTSPDPTPEPTEPPTATPEPTAAPSDDKPDNAAFARMRRDKDAADRRAAEAERRAEELARQRAPQPTPAPASTTSADPEPDKATNWEGWLEWRNRQLEATIQNQGKTVEEVKAWKESQERQRAAETTKSSAIKTLENYEAAYAKTVTDYADVREFAIGKIADSLRVMRPDLQGDKFTEALTHQLLVLAGTAEAQGYNPIEHLYHQAKTQWGYQPKPAATEAPKADDAPEAPAKPSLKQIVENKKKSASSLTAGGKNPPAPLSKDAVKGMKFHDIASLSPEKFREWENASKQIEANG